MSPPTTVPTATPDEAAAHVAERLELETDCADVAAINLPQGHDLVAVDA